MKSKHHHRRSVLVSWLALGAAAKVGFRDIDAIAAPASAAPPLLVRITLDGKVYEFDETKGRDLGDYKGPNFVQRCLMVALPDLPMQVFMRPDRDSARVEVVFELGRMWNATPVNLGAYSVEIRRGDKELAHLDVPAHYWFSRWRWQSARRPVIAKAADLVAAGLVPPYSAERAIVEPPKAAAKPPAAKPAASAAKQPTPDVKLAANAPASSTPSLPQSSEVIGLPGSSVITGSLRRGPDGQLEVVATPVESPAPAPALPGAAQARPAAKPAVQPVAAPSGPVRTYSIMGLAGLTAYMPTTGDRDDIGAVTEAQATWLCNGSADALDLMFAQAEADGTVPWHMRDEKTGAPLNFDQYPKAGWSGPTFNNPFVAQLKSPVTPDESHQPQLTYVPFLITGDPYYLEAMQLQMTWLIGAAAPEYRFDNKCIYPKGQTRAYAWCLRDSAQLAKVTPAEVPNWLLPRAYWERILENNRLWFEETFVHNQNPPFPVFRVAIKIRDGDDDPGLAGVPRISPWEEQYLAFTMGWVVLMGFQSWREAFTWKVGSTIAQTSGKSGWGRAYGSPYLICLRRTGSAPWAQSWKEAWDLNVQLQGWEITDPNHFSEKNTGYLTYYRAVLAIAARLGIPEARECYDWADQVIRMERHDYIQNRWSVYA